MNIVIINIYNTLINSLFQFIDKIFTLSIRKLKKPIVLVQSETIVSARMRKLRLRNHQKNGWFLAAESQVEMAKPVQKEFCALELHNSCSTITLLIRFRQRYTTG